MQDSNYTVRGGSGTVKAVRPRGSRGKKKSLFFFGHQEAHFGVFYDYKEKDSGWCGSSMVRLELERETDAIPSVPTTCVV